MAKVKQAGGYGHMAKNNGKTFINHKVRRNRENHIFDRTNQTGHQKNSFRKS